MIEQVGDVRAAELLAEHDRLARGLLGAHNGQEIDKTDGFLMLFRRPVDAVCYALRYHSALRDLSSRQSCQMAARVGIHLGEVSLRKNDPEDVSRGAKPIELEGLAKHIAARIMSCSEGGRTLLSQEAFEVARRGAVGHSALEQEGELAWVRHGSYLLKGAKDPRILCEVGAPGVVAAGPPAATSAKATRVDTGGEGAPRSSGPARNGVALLAIALLSIGGYYYGTTASNPTATTSPAPAAAAPDPSAPAPANEPPQADIQLHVVVQPEGASISVDGVDRGPSPLTVPVPSETLSVELTAASDGYTTASSTCTIDPGFRERGSGLCTFSLAPEPRASRPPRPTQNRPPEVPADTAEAAPPGPPAGNDEDAAEPRRPQIQLID